MQNWYKITREAGYSRNVLAEKKSREAPKQNPQSTPERIKKQKPSPIHVQDAGDDTVKSRRGPPVGLGNVDTAATEGSGPRSHKRGALLWFNPTIGAAIANPVWIIDQFCERADVLSPGRSAST